MKTILMKLRDNQIPGVLWLVKKKDAEYEKMLYSEGLQSVVDKKSGQVVQRWMKVGEANHFLDCEAQALMMAMRAGVFSATKVDIDQLKIVLENKKPEGSKVSVAS